jgi:hypothetical protein
MPSLPSSRQPDARRTQSGKRTTRPATRGRPLTLELLEDRLAPAIATPTFANLSAPTVTYGTPSVTISGLLQSNSLLLVPAGETVQVTVAGVTQNATLTSNDTFSTPFNTSALTVGASPYTITFDYNPVLNNDHNFAAAETRSVLTMVQAVPVFTVPTTSTEYGSATTTISGTLGEPLTTVAPPAGESVQVTLNGVAQTDTLGAGGNFSATFNTPTLGVGGSPYTVGFTYAGDTNFASAAGSAPLDVYPEGTFVSPSNTEVLFSVPAQTVTLKATVTNGTSPVTVGSVQFTVYQGNAVIGNPINGNVNFAGVATANFTLPGLTPVGNYTIQAIYNGSTDYSISLQNGTLTVDGAPFIQPIGINNTLTFAHNPPSYTVAISASSPVGNPLTYSAVVVGDNPLYDLQQKYQFKGLGTLTLGATGYMLSSGTVNGFGNQYYVLRPSDGALFAYDGSGSFASSFGRGTPIATLGAGVYIDPTQLLNAQPPLDYTTIYNLQQQYQFIGLGYFNVGSAAYVLHTTQPGPGVGGYYLVRAADGALFAYDGSGSYAHTFANGTPIATLGVSVYNNPNILLGASATPALYAQLNQINRQYDLEEIGGSFYTNTLGHGAEWFYSPVLNQFGQHWYTLALNTGGTQAILTAWEGYADSEVGAVVATLDPSVYANPAWLADATAPPVPAVTTTINSSNVTINLPSNSYVGTFTLVVSVTDGLLTTTQTVPVSVTDSAPTITVQQNNQTVGGTVTLAHGDFPQSYTLTTADAQNDPVATSVTVTPYNQLFALEQQYRFQGLGYFSNGGATAYVLSAPQTNSLGNQYYLLDASGDLFAFNAAGTYKDTLTKGTAIATLGANVYNDPALLTNAQPSVDYTTLYNLMQQYQFTAVGTFTAGATALVLHSNQSGPGSGGYYLVSPAGGLYAYDGSGSYAHSFGGTKLAQVGPGVYANPALLLSAQATPALYVQLQAVEQQYDLKGLGYFISGTPAYVFTGATDPTTGSPYYLLNTSGGLYAYDGSPSYTTTFSNSANLRATVDPSVYTNPSLLTGAKAPVDGSTVVTATINNGTLQVNAPISFVGSVVVNLAASDGIMGSTDAIVFTSTDTAPVPTPIPNQTVSRSGPALNLTLSSTDAEHDTVTYSASAVAYSAAYTLQQQYHFQGLGYFTTPDGTTAYVLTIAGLNNNHNSYFLLSSAGGLYAYDGSANYSSTISNSANLIATLSASVYNSPTLLTQAQAPAGLTSNPVSVNGNTLTVNASSLSAGAVFEVFVTASDGAETTRTSFLVTVSP